MPGEKREARLELMLPGQKWSVAAKAEVHYPLGRAFPNRELG